MEKLKYYLFAVGAFALAVLYYLYDRRGRQIEQLVLDAQKQLLGQQLESIRDQALRSEADHEKAMDRYARLKQRHAELLERLGLPTSKPPGNSSLQ